MVKHCEDVLTYIRNVSAKKIAKLGTIATRVVFRLLLPHVSAVERSKFKCDV